MGKGKWAIEHVARTIDHTLLQPNLVEIDCGNGSIIIKPVKRMPELGLER